MTQRYPYFNFSNTGNCEVLAWQLSSGEVVILIGENVGSSEEQAVTLILNAEQWDTIKELINKSQPLPAASGF